MPLLFFFAADTCDGGSETNGDGEEGVERSTEECQDACLRAREEKCTDFDMMYMLAESSFRAFVDVSSVTQRGTGNVSDLLKVHNTTISNRRDVW